MASLETVLLGLGGKTIAKLVARKFGADMGQLAGDAIAELAKLFGAAPDADAVEKRITEVAAADPQAAANTIAQAEYNLAGQILAEAELARAEAEKLKVANDQQALTAELLKEQMKAGGWKSDWLYAWQWFLMFAWAWSIVLVHVLNAALRIFAGASEAQLPAVDLGMLATVTGLYLGLHMGGHTALEFLRGGVFERREKP